MSSEQEMHATNTISIENDHTHFDKDHLPFVKVNDVKKSSSTDCMAHVEERTPPSFGITPQTSDQKFSKQSSNADPYFNRGHCDFSSRFTSSSIESSKLNPLLAIASHQWFDRLFHSHQTSTSCMKETGHEQLNNFRFGNDPFPTDSSGSSATFYGPPSDLSDSSQFNDTENGQSTRLKISMNLISRNESFPLSEPEHLLQQHHDQSQHHSDPHQNSVVYENAFDSYPCSTTIYGSDSLSTTDFPQLKPKSVANNSALSAEIDADYMNTTRRGRLNYGTENKLPMFHSNTRCHTPEDNESHCIDPNNRLRQENHKSIATRFPYPLPNGRRSHIESSHSKSNKIDINVSEWQVTNCSNSVSKTQSIPDMSTQMSTRCAMNGYNSEERLSHTIHRDPKLIQTDPQSSEVDDLMKEPFANGQATCCEPDIKQNNEHYSNILSNHSSQMSTSHSNDILSSWRPSTITSSSTNGDQGFLRNGNCLKLNNEEDKPVGADWNINNRYISKRRNLDSDSQSLFGTSMNVDMIPYIPHNLLSSLTNPCQLQSSHLHENHCLFPQNNQFQTGGEMQTDQFDDSESAYLNFCNPSHVNHNSVQYNQLIPCQNDCNSTATAAAAAAAMATNFQTNLNCYILPQMNGLPDSGQVATNTSHLRHRLTNVGFSQNHSPNISVHCSQRNTSSIVHQQPMEIDYNPRELEAFSELFKQRRIKLGVTQADVGKALGNLKIAGVGSLSQSTICRFESLTLSHNNMVALKPVLQAWLEEAEAEAAERLRHPEIYDPDEEKSRKRTSITDSEKRSLEAFFSIQPRPSSEKISQIADKLNLKKNVVRVWFCNQRQKQKRMKFSTLGLLHHSNGRN